MGNEGSSFSPHSLLNKSDIEKLRQTFPKSAPSHLWPPWTSVFDPNTLNLIEKGLCDSSGKLSFQNYQQLAGDMLKAGVDEKLNFLIKISQTKKEDVTSESIKQAVLKIMVAFAELHKVTKKFPFSTEKDLNDLSESIVHDLVFPSQKRKATFSKDPEVNSIDADDLEKWFLNQPLLETAMKDVFNYCFQISVPQPSNLTPIIPRDSKTSLSMQQVLFLNSALPHEFRSIWRPLFNTEIHGESFSKLVGAIPNQGPTLVIVWDKTGNVFGGFAASSWKVGPKFYGKQENFLFHLHPKMNIYETTPFNTNYQYFNLKQKTLPNGLGMGGQFEYFGFWIDSEFGLVKTSPTCSTYHSAPLGELDGQIRNLEVWGVGEEEEKEEGMKSVLDMDPEAQAVLEMMGKTFHSKAIREVDQAEEEKKKQDARHGDEGFQDSDN